MLLGGAGGIGLGFGGFGSLRALGVLLGFGAGLRYGKRGLANFFGALCSQALCRCYFNLARRTIVFFSASARASSRSASSAAVRCRAPFCTAISLSSRLNRACANSLALPLGYCRIKPASSSELRLARTRCQFANSYSSSWSCWASVSFTFSVGNTNTSSSSEVLSHGICAPLDAIRTLRRTRLKASSRRTP